MTRVFLAASAALLLAACTTPYQEMGLRGGVQSFQISSDIAQVTARGSATTDPDKVQRYALRKAAETTIAAGYDLFQVVADVDRTRALSGGGGYSTGGLGGLPALGVNMPFVRPGQTFLIRMSRGDVPTGASGAVFDAQEVLDHLGGRGRRLAQAKG